MTGTIMDFGVSQAMTNIQHDIQKLVAAAIAITMTRLESVVEVRC